MTQSKEMKLTSFLQRMILLMLFIPVAVMAQDNGTDREPHRPLIHFTPKKGWMNDPNGMVFYNGKYHLFFQHNPNEPVWGPMHWGHATSTDLVNWEEQPIALYPDALGTIFSGSAVIDVNNTAGFGKNAMVAIYTNHSHTIEKEGFDTYETQGIAYSLDEGKTWTKYKGNPVLPNPRIRDFRDPKVMWYEPAQKWIMTLATLDHITFYSSPDLKSWKEESKFGKNVGAHGGVWECPDLIPFTVEGKQVWVLIVNLNPGGPNGGSATQYFVGDFDGSAFKPFDTQTRWMDYGPDNYAGVTWSNTGDRKVLIGWMSNWQYANVVPTQNWRSATTVARELKLVKSGSEYLLASEPVKELKAAVTKSTALKNIKAGNFDITKKTGKLEGAAMLNFTTSNAKSFDIILSNAQGEQVVIGFDAKANQYFIDRTKSGATSFEKDFAKKHIAPRLSNNKEMDVTLVIDVASVELFADNGLSLMTGIFFPTTPFTDIKIQSPDKMVIQQLQLGKLK
ncbi:MAG: glycoside hydrolase family 32 protein [Niabella sp.]